MSELPQTEPAEREGSADVGADAPERDLASLLLAGYFVALIAIVVGLLVVPVVL